jgi:hypothetical protein
MIENNLLAQNRIISYWKRKTLQTATTIFSVSNKYIFKANKNYQTF